MEIGTNSLVNEFQSWGIAPFDRSYNGLPLRTFNLLRACGKEAVIFAVGSFLKAGIERKQRVAIVSFEHPSLLLSEFKEHGFLFEDELISEQLVYLYYKPLFSYAMSFSTNYWQLYSEARRLAKSDTGRIAFMNAEVLFNLETRRLAQSSAEHVMSSFGGGDCLVLGCYQNANTASHNCLDEMAQMSLSAYLDIQGPGYNDHRYELVLRKFPLVDCGLAEPLELCLASNNEAWLK